MAGADLGGVLGEGGVADEAESMLDGPLGLGELAQPLVRCLMRAQVRDRVDGLAADGSGRAVGAMAQDAYSLGGVGESKSRPVTVRDLVTRVFRRPWPISWTWRRAVTSFHGSDRSLWCSTGWLALTAKR